MAGVKGKTGAKPGNQNARKHGFYSSALLPGEEEFFEEAKTLSVEHEIGMLRIMCLRAAKFEAGGGTMTENAQNTFNARIGRLRDMMMCQSIMERNARESGANDDSLDETLDRFQASGMHKAVFKPRKKGNGKARNGA